MWAGYREGDEDLIFQVNESNPVDADVIIIDEVSMVDVVLMNSLLRAVSDNTRLVMVGDVDPEKAVSYIDKYVSAEKDMGRIEKRKVDEPGTVAQKIVRQK